MYATRLAALTFVFLGATAALAQVELPPVLQPRGAQNEFTRRPAPDTVSAGGILRLTGLNFVMASEWRAGSLPLPVEYGTPPVRVSIGNRHAGLMYVSPTVILCQVPVDAPQGVMQVTVQRGEQVSRAIRFNVQRAAPALRTQSAAGYGQAEGASAGSALDLRAMGLGRTEPAVESGWAGSADAPSTPADPVRLLIDGMAVNARITLSATTPGEFEIQAEPVETAQPGDVVQLIAAGNLNHLVTFDRRLRPSLSFLPLPEGLTDPRALIAADLRHALAGVNSGRNEEGCYESWVFDFARSRATRQDGCLTAANRQAATPLVAPANTGLLAAWLGPPEADPANGVSNRLRIINPASDKPVDVLLPFTGQTIQALPNGSLLSVSPGGEAVRIDPDSGEVESTTPVTNNPVPGAGVGGALNAAIQAREIDLGDGVKRRILSQPPRQATAAGVPLVVADNAEGTVNPQLVLVNNRLDILGTKPFPPGWLPLLPPAQIVTPRPGQPPPAPQPAFVPVDLDVLTRTSYVLARRSDDSRHGLAFFTADEAPARSVEFPESWFAAACTSAIPLFNLELTRRIGVFGTRTPEAGFRAQCPARGLIEVGLGPQATARVSEVPGQGSVNISAGINDVNDYLYATDSDPAQQGAATSMYIFDSASESALRMDLPGGMNSFVQPRPLYELNAILALARNAAPGDEGFIYFDLATGETRLLPTPEGFTALQFAAVFPATRKLLARGIRRGGSGSGYIIFDLMSFDSIVVDNPEGIAFVGALPATQPPAQGVVLERFSPKSNSVVAMGYNAARRPVGLVLLRLH
jgi:uncharacterized protein (TIGR03437 family)